jgi:hypothetical protein
MLNLRDLKAEDLQGLDAEAAVRIATLLLDRVAAMDDEYGRQISERDAEIKLTAAKLQKLTFELARLKRLKFGTKTALHPGSARARQSGRGLAADTGTGGDPHGSAGIRGQLQR